MVEIFNIAVGIITVILLGLGVGPVIDCVKKSIPLDPPNENLKDIWEKLVKGNKGGSILGNLERIIYFGAFWTKNEVIIGGWLAFKVATKWNVWSNIISVPKQLENVDPLDYLNARRRWGSQLLMTFLIGTACNIIISFIGFLVGNNAHTYLVSLLS